MFSEFFDRLLKRDQSSSRNEVKQRLQLLLAHDRSDLTPQTLDAIRREIIAVVSKYIEIDDEGLEFMLESDQRLSALVVNFPIRRIRSEAEQRQPVETTTEPISLDEDGAEDRAGETAETAADEIFQIDLGESAQGHSKPQPARPGQSKQGKQSHQGTQTQGAKPKATLAEPPPEVELDPNEDLPAHLHLDGTADLDPDLGSASAAE
ncbi:MAG: cell division topological specificity factor MinE [Synechococcales cyanobacterium RM1_1_8]|nr:cell division topological specificity factor MinE [Synechococcales cyanobacterium RM1_1_8]